ncbi:MAG: hypothetical protein ACR2MS_02275 [Weeksellaceae bacterium]
MTLRVRHIRNENKQPLATLASMLWADDWVKLAMSRCNKLDTFNKARGRKIALGRVQADHSIVYNKDKPLDALWLLLQGETILVKKDEVSLVVDALRDYKELNRGLIGYQSRELKEGELDYKLLSSNNGDKFLERKISNLLPGDVVDGTTLGDSDTQEARFVIVISVVHNESYSAIYALGKSDSRTNTIMFRAYDTHKKVKVYT